MPIVYNERARTLTLQTLHTTYQMKIGPYGVLLHTYYGSKVERGDMSALWPACDRGFSGNPGDAGADRTFSLDTLPQEFGSCGVGDFRVPAVVVEQADGSQAADFRYRSHEIRMGKYGLPGLPALFAERDQAETLTVVLEDVTGACRLTLTYAILPALDVITRTAALTNLGDGALRVRKLASASLDLPFGPWELLHFHGRHAMERIAEREKLGHGVTSFGSLRGTSSHQHSPTVLLAAPETTEEFGPCLAMSLVYSGGFLAQAEVDQQDMTRALLGVQSQGFCHTLQRDETFQAPEAVLSWSGHGFSELSHHLHDAVRDHLTRGKFAHSARPVLINSWEACFFDFTADTLVELAQRAAPLGIDLLVMDDGWFTDRPDDHGGLGDWVVDEKKLPGGLAPLCERVNAAGLDLGIWVEPEMVSENTALYRDHPDWALSIPGRAPCRSRSQLVLDLSRREVVDYLFDKLSAILDSAPIPYVKWDMNRSLSDVWSAALPPERQGEVPHRYVLGLYDLLERLTARFPDVLFEGCSGGGGRFDLGMLYYTPQIWCSDDTDAVERLTIQYGTSFVFPASAVGAHVSICPNQQTGRTVPLDTRAAVAMCGTFGYELDPAELTEEERSRVAEQVKTYKSLQPLLFEGDYYRLTDPAKNELAACQFVSKDRSESLVVLVHTDAHANPVPLHVRLRGLDPAAVYELDGTDCGGDQLMHAGFTPALPFGEYESRMLHLIRKG